MKEIVIVSLLEVVALLASSALHNVRKFIVDYEYDAYIERVKDGRGFSEWP
jgi:hypothetical protein